MLAPVEHRPQKLGRGVILDVAIGEGEPALPIIVPLLKVLVVGEHSGRPQRPKVRTRQNSRAWRMWS